MQNKNGIEIGTKQVPTCGACKNWSLDEDGWCSANECECRDDDTFAGVCPSFDRHPDSEISEG
jgi:hypothetical protein